MGKGLTRLDRDEKFKKKSKKLGDYELTTTVLLLSKSKHPSGVRIEFRKLSFPRRRTFTVEVELLRGDGKILLKHSYRKVTLQNPTKIQLDAVTEEFKQYAREQKLI